MGKHKHIKTHHLYLGAGGVVAVVALVVALTFGLSSAQTYTPPPDSGTYTPPPDSGTYTPPPDSGTYTPPPDSGTYTPPPSCPSGQWWDFAANVCKTSDTGGQTGTYVPPATGTYTTPPCCPSGQWWDFATNMCKTSDMSGGQIGTYPAPTNMPACAPGVMPTAASPCQMPPPPSCPSDQWYNYSTSSCTSSTMPPPVNTVQCT
ncbi:hypothetical protein HZC21_05975, partial [Candidatus Peregrinibacteria bacterium]|nr:hypothetical protein [Candidatus Peregrinibacteria bacterium]